MPSDSRSSGIPVVPLPFQVALIKLQRFQDILPRLAVRDAIRNVPAGVFVVALLPCDPTLNCAGDVCDIRDVVLIINVKIPVLVSADDITHAYLIALLVFGILDTRAYDYMDMWPAVRLVFMN